MSSTLPDLIEIAARHGFPTITVRPWAYLEAVEQGFTEAGLRRRLHDAGVSVAMIDCLSKGLPGLPPFGEITREMRSTLPRDAIDPCEPETVIGVAEALEAPWVNVSHFRGHAVPFESMAEAIAGFCGLAAERGTGVALEFNPDTGLPDIAYAQRIAEASGAPNCRITVDFWHLDRSGGGVADIISLPPEALAGLQLNDRIRPAPGTPYVPMTGRSLPGEGELPLGELVRAALANSPGISAEVEVFSAELAGLSADDAAARVARTVVVWRNSEGIET